MPVWHAETWFIYMLFPLGTNFWFFPTRWQIKYTNSAKIIFFLHTYQGNFLYTLVGLMLQELWVACNNCFILMWLICYPFFWTWYICDECSVFLYFFNCSILLIFCFRNCVKSQKNYAFNNKFMVSTSQTAPLVYPQWFASQTLAFKLLWRFNLNVGQNLGLSRVWVPLCRFL